MYVRKVRSNALWTPTEIDCSVNPDCHWRGNHNSCVPVHFRLICDLLAVCKLDVLITKVLRRPIIVKEMNCIDDLLCAYLKYSAENLFVLFLIFVGTSRIWV